MLAHNPDFMVFTGNANPSMAQEIAHHLGISLGAAHVGRFSDGEVTVEIHQNVRAREVFVVQSTCAPTNDNLMELLIMVDALKRASAERISAVIPYFGYARQDRRPRSARVPITAKVVANMLQTVAACRTNSAGAPCSFAAAPGPRLPSLSRYSQRIVELSHSPCDTTKTSVTATSPPDFGSIRYR
jgi:hypothetical protein